MLLKYIKMWAGHRRYAPVLRAAAALLLLSSANCSAQTLDTNRPVGGYFGDIRLCGCDPTGNVSTANNSTSCDLKPACSSGALCDEFEQFGDGLHRDGVLSEFKSRLARRGLKFDFYASQFYQGLAAGGREQSWPYGGKLDLFTNVDGQKVGLWQGLFVDAHLEARLGQSVNNIDGLLTPSNIAMAFPENEGNVIALTGLKVTQALSENFAVFAGKINTLDEFPIRYNRDMGLGRPGLSGFMNTSLIFNPIAARTVPYAAAGTGFAILQDLEPVFSFCVFDPEERATKGLENLYERGVVLVPDFIFRIQPLGLPGIYNLGGTYSSANYTSVDPAAYLNIQLPPIVFPQESGSWSLYTNFFQALWVDPCNAQRRWGVFGGLGLSDGNPNPIKYTAIAGFGGQVMRANRPADTFGVGVFQLGLSSQFRALTAPVLAQQDEFGLEWFYNAALTNNIRLTGDCQVVRPSTDEFQTAIIPGLRLVAAF
ncbi:MAG: carbohydrate porin [Pirellulaceae bacterium]|nr:carbohydrate porin [Pirellulaceae bacterium]